MSVNFGPLSEMLCCIYKPSRLVRRAARAVEGGAAARARAGGAGPARGAAGQVLRQRLSARRPSRSRARGARPSEGDRRRRSGVARRATPFRRYLT